MYSLKKIKSHSYKRHHLGCWKYHFGIQWTWSYLHTVTISWIIIIIIIFYGTLETWLMSVLVDFSNKNLWIYYWYLLFRMCEPSKLLHWYSTIQVCNMEERWKIVTGRETHWKWCKKDGDWILLSFPHEGERKLY